MDVCSIPVDKKLLENLSMVDLFFDGAGCEQPVDGHIAILPDPPGPLSTLHVRARVPVGIKNNHPKH